MSLLNGLSTKKKVKIYRCAFIVSAIAGLFLLTAGFTLIYGFDIKGDLPIYIAIAGLFFVMLGGSLFWYYTGAKNDISEEENEKLSSGKTEFIASGKPRGRFRFEESFVREQIKLLSEETGAQFTVEATKAEILPVAEDTSPSLIYTIETENAQINIDEESIELCFSGNAPVMIMDDDLRKSYRKWMEFEEKDDPHNVPEYLFEGSVNPLSDQEIFYLIRNFFKVMYKAESIKFDADISEDYRYYKVHVSEPAAKAKRFQ